MSSRCAALGNVPTAGVQRMMHHDALDLFERNHGSVLEGIEKFLHFIGGFAVRREPPHIASQGAAVIPRVDSITFCENNGSLDGAFDFADISRPGIRNHCFHRSSR